MDTQEIIKIDELEDVFEVAASFFKSQGKSAPEAIFMEIQAKNTFLLSEGSLRHRNIKPFSLIKGTPDFGIPMSKIIGI